MNQNLDCHRSAEVGLRLGGASVRHQQGELLHLRHGEGRGQGQEAGQQQQRGHGRYHLVIVQSLVTTDHQPSLCDDTADAGNAEERERGPSPVSRLTGGVTFRHHGTMTSSKCGMW